MGVAENIDALLVKHDITQETLARVAGISQAAVSGWRPGKKPSNSSLKKICDYFGLEPNDILSDTYGLAAKEHGDFIDLPKWAKPIYSSGEARVPLRVLGTVHAGELDEEKEAYDMIDVPASVISGHKRAFALCVVGGCVNKVIAEGEHVIVDPDMTPQNGSIVVAETEEYQAILRRWFKGNKKLMLSADSYDDYDDLVFDEEDGPVRVRGVVFWHQASKEME